MRVVLQRVLSASVTVDETIVGKIARGWLVLLGVQQGDSIESVRWLAEKTVHLRAFQDDQGKMNRSVMEVGGRVLVVSQFTLAGDCRKGRRPSFDRAADLEDARKLYDSFCEQVAWLGAPVERGIFQADMQVALVNDGPVTFVIDHPDKIDVLLSLENI
jgi:D-tyrosyl-tRNA(Tyr) deacylase